MKFASNVEYVPPVPEEIEIKKNELLKEIASLGIYIEEMNAKLIEYPQLQKDFVEIEEKLKSSKEELEKINEELASQKRLYEQMIARVDETIARNEELLDERKGIEEKNESLRAEIKTLKEEKFAVEIELVESKTKLEENLLKIDESEILFVQKNKKIEELEQKIYLVKKSHEEKVVEQKKERDQADQELAEIQEMIKNDREAIALERANFASESKIVSEALEQSKADIQISLDAISEATEAAAKIKEEADQYSITKKAEMEAQEQELIKREGAANFLATSTEEKLERARLTKAELEKIHGRQFPHLIF